MQEELDAIDLAMDTMTTLSTSIRDSFGLYLNKTASELIGGDVYKRQSFTWSPNVTWLMDETLTSVYFEDINTEVYGFSYHTTEIKEARLEDIQVPLNSRIQILMAHGGDAAHLPINFNSLEPVSYTHLDVYKRQPLSFPARKLIDLTRECMRNHPELDYTAFRFCRPEEVENLI